MEFFLFSFLKDYFFFWYSSLKWHLKIILKRRQTEKSLTFIDTINIFKKKTFYTVAGIKANFRIRTSYLMLRYDQIYVALFHD